MDTTQQPVAPPVAGAPSGSRRSRKRRVGAAPSELPTSLSAHLGAIIASSAEANASAAAGAGTPSLVRPPFRLDGEEPVVGGGILSDAPIAAPAGANLGERFKLLGRPGQLDAAGSIGGFFSEGGGGDGADAGGGGTSPSRVRSLLGPAGSLGAGAVPVLGSSSPARGIRLTAGPAPRLAGADGVAGLARFLNDTATEALARRGPRSFPPAGEFAGVGGGPEGAARAPPPRGRAAAGRTPLAGGAALAQLLGDLAADAAASEAADAAFVEARRAAAAAGGFNARAPPKLAALERAGLAAAARALAAESAASGGAPPPLQTGNHTGSHPVGALAAVVHGTPGAARMAAAAAAAPGRGDGGARLDALRAALRGELPAKPAAAAALLRHRLRAVDGDADGVVGADDLLRVVMGMREGAALRGAGPPDGAPGGVAPEDVGALVRALQPAAADAVNRVPGVSGEAFIEWVLAEGGAPAAAEPPPPPPPPAPAPAPPAAENNLKASGRPVFDASAAQKMALFRASWETKHGAAAKKEAALDAAVPAPGPTWASAAPREWRVLHLAQPAPPPPPAAPI
jgi:hypothetical protein